MRQQILAPYSDVVEKIVAFSGPLPNPEAFEKYDQALPGAADRILRMAENEQKIRGSGQKGAIDNDRWRVAAALLTSIGLLAVAGMAIYFGQFGAGVSLGLAGSVLAALRVLFRHLEREKKDE